MNSAFEDLSLLELTKLAHAVIAEGLEMSEQDGQSLLEYLCLRQTEVRYLEYLTSLTDSTS